MSTVRRTAKRTNSSSELNEEEVVTTHVNNKLSSKTTPTNNLINPEIITYIARVQGERDKTAKKIIIGDQPERKQDPNQYSGLNDNMNVDKTQKTIAKKGLLYLLNNLSGGTFCPEINIYFEEMKEMKKSELNNMPFKGNLLPRESAKLMLTSSIAPEANTVLTPQTNLLRKDLGEKESPYALNFKRRQVVNDKAENKDEEGFGIKAFREDFDQGKKRDANTNSTPVMFHFNKEKQAKMKIMSKDRKEKKKKIKISSYNDTKDEKTEFIEDNTTLNLVPNCKAFNNYYLGSSNKAFEGEGI